LKNCNFKSQFRFSSQIQVQVTETDIRVVGGWRKSNRAQIDR